MLSGRKSGVRNRPQGKGSNGQGGRQEERAGNEQAASRRRAGGEQAGEEKGGQGRREKGRMNPPAPNTAIKEAPREKDVLAYFRASTLINVGDAHRKLAARL